MSREYLKELRAKRRQIVENLLTGIAHLPTSTVIELRHYYLQGIQFIQNSTRGKLGELFGEVTLTCGLNADERMLTRDAATFKTPFGKRRVNVFWEERQLALEAKMGYVYLSVKIADQIKKDRYLLEEKTFNRVIWVLFQGSSEKARKALISSGIEIIEGWPLEKMTAL